MQAPQFPRLGPRSARRHRSERSGWRILLLGLVSLLVGGAVYAMTIVGMAVQEVSTPVPPELPPQVRPAPVQVGQRINVLVLGLDDDSLRSDTIILVSLDPEARKAGILHIPRDTRVLLAGKGTVEKVNAAYAYGVGDKQFPANLRALKTIEQLLSIRIHYTAVINLNAFRRAVDELGGVTVDVPFAMDYDDPKQNLSIHLRPGRQKLSGQQALEFVRWRHDNDGTGYPDGDLGRIRTQQAFLKAMLEVALRPANLPKLPTQALAIARYVETTVEPSRLVTLTKLAAGLGKEDVEFATVPGVDATLYDPNEGQDLSFYVHDPIGTARIVDRLIRGVDPAAASGVKVEIQAGAGDTRGTHLADMLTAHGFSVRLTRVPTLSDRTQVVDLTGEENKRQLVGRALISRGIDVDLVSLPEPNPAVDIRIVLGRDSTGR